MNLFKGDADFSTFLRQVSCAFLAEAEWYSGMTACGFSWLASKAENRPQASFLLGGPMSWTKTTTEGQRNHGHCDN
jgi:hypothetical protein